MPPQPAPEPQPEEPIAVPVPEDANGAKPPREGTRTPEPARSPLALGAAVRRFWPIVVLPALLLGSLALLVSANRSPTYTAEARLIVGGLDVSTRSVPGFAEASESLAQTYSRSVTADSVVRPVARRLGISPAQARRRLSGTGLPDSAVLRVQATGPNARSATRLANSGARSLIAYVDNLRPETDQADTLLRDYQRAALSLSRAQTQLELIRPLVVAGGGAAVRRRFDETTVDVQTGRLRIKTLGDLYSLRRQTSQETDLLSVLNLASGASDDGSSYAQRFLFIGVVAGLAIGLALASALEARRQRRT